MSPHCGNCESWVSEDYVRVRFPPTVDPDNLPGCLHCPDKIVAQGEVRDARSNASR